MRNDRLVLLAPPEIRYAEADGNTVWMATERGRIQAATRDLENVERSLRPYGFRRVHRRFHELVPVSRRHAPELRRMLGV